MGFYCQMNKNPFIIKTLKFIDTTNSIVRLDNISWLMGNLELIKFYQSSRFKPAEFKALFCRVALTSLIFISIIAILLYIVFNLTTIFVVNKTNNSFSDSRVQSAFLMQFPSHDVKRYYDVEVTRKSHQHPSGTF